MNFFIEKQLIPSRLNYGSNQQHRQIAGLISLLKALWNNNSKL